MSAKKRITNLTIDRVALVSAGSNPHADVVLTKNKPTDEPPKETEQMTTNIDKSKLNADEQKALDALLAKCATVEGQPAPEELIKTLPPELQALVKSATDTAAKAVAKAEEAQAEVALEKAKREESEFVAKHSVLVKAFPGKAEDSASLLFRVKKAMSAEDYAALETLLKAGNTALASAMQEDGNDFSAPSGGTEDIVKKLPEMARARAAEKKINYAKALEELTVEHASAIQKSRRDKARRARRDDDNND